ncbi:uncharacterized protein PHACADRAFT_33473 [Phanerochaete carnosa HHB-10118-sp]|uniref:Uncharacterized protein n=1 Tax=Phanerochaete carnosa (strain HHB-10118-sp) TaxID=650164 RepID=K5UIR7_PHACS|nr:uncharacterized protein PHACADRAFT_33473 [Phanerochaete carnosa HHB-10118-sp]EKM49416.1 hypothetical protein PHACADRAFT_33473 [Phanerochaete carnosa HHB-10118-sp]
MRFSCRVLAEPGDLAAAEATFALHSSTPRVETAYQFHSDIQAGRRVSGRLVRRCCVQRGESSKAGIRAIEVGETVARNGFVVSSFDHGCSPNFVLCSSTPNVQVLSFDHILPSPDLTLGRPAQTAALYANLTSSNFRSLHSFLYAASAGPRPHIRYILRHILPAGHASDRERMYPSGYSVALDLKKMDYLATADRVSSTPSLLSLILISSERTDSANDSDASDNTFSAPGEADAIAALLQQYPKDSDTDYTIPLTSDELSNIGLQATQLIADASDPLATLKQLSQNFPVREFYRLLCRRQQRTRGRDRVKDTRALSSASMAWLKGVPLMESDMNPLSYVHLPSARCSQLTIGPQVAAPPAQGRRGHVPARRAWAQHDAVVRRLTHRAVSAAQTDADALDVLFDASDCPEGGQWPQQLAKYKAIVTRLMAIGELAAIPLEDRLEADVEEIAAHGFRALAAAYEEIEGIDTEAQVGSILASTSDFSWRTKYKAIVTRLTVIEGLAAVPVICSHITGTLATNMFAIDKITLKTYGPLSADDAILLSAYASHTKNLDAADVCAVGTLSDPPRTRAGIKLLDFKPFNLYRNHLSRGVVRRTRTCC